MKITINQFLFIFIVIPFFMISIIYASFSSKLLINGTAMLRIVSDIRITNLKVIEQTDGAYETYSNEFNKDSTSIYVTLPNINSTITYEVTIKNFSSNNYVLTNIIEEIFSNDNIKYEISTSEKDNYLAQETETFRIKISNKDGFSNLSTTLVLKYVFEQDIVTAPIITGGSEEWVASPKTITLENVGTATTGVSHYEYYITAKTAPTESTIPTGITDNSVKVNNEDINYIYYRTVANNGTKSSWSNPQITKIDTKYPEIKMMASGKYYNDSTELIYSTTFGPSNGTTICNNLTSNTTNITSLNSLRGLGNYTIKCTATSNAGLTTEETAQYNLMGLFYYTKSLLCTYYSKEACSYNGTQIIVPNDAIQYGPYFEIQQGCYKVNYEGVNLNNYCSGKYSVYQNKPSITFKILSLTTSSTNASYYVYINQNLYKFQGKSGIEFTLTNLCTTPLTVSNIKVEQVEACPNS